MDLTSKPEKVLLRMRDERLAKLGRLGPMVAGSVVKAKDKRAWYLTDKVNQKTRTVCLTEELYEEALNWNAAHREAKRLLQELSDIQRALIALKLQAERESR